MSGVADKAAVWLDVDDDGKRMIVEIPAPECAEGTGHAEDYRAARAMVETVKPGAMLEITRVAFFDFLHEQHGAAPNGIELHPVLQVRVVD